MGVLDDEIREIEMIEERAKKASVAVKEADEKGTPAEVTQVIQQKLPQVSRLMQRLPLFETAEEAIEASKKPELKELKILAGNVEKYVTGE